MESLGFMLQEEARPVTYSNAPGLRRPFDSPDVWPLLTPDGSEPPGVAARESVAAHGRKAHRWAQEGNPSWGAPKIREKLRPQCAPLRCLAISTVHAVLDRHGLVRQRRRRRPPLTGTPSHASQPNALWCADYKGQFMLADQR
jgi:hypothetical protein